MSSHVPQRYSFGIAAMTAFISGLQVSKFRHTSPADVRILSQRRDIVPRVRSGLGCPHPLDRSRM
jgi:hypothetical protein